MEKPTVLGYMKDQPRALRAAFARRAEFVEPFRQLFVQLPIKKVLFFGSGTSYNASQIAAYEFKHLCKLEAQGHYPTVFAPVSYTHLNQIHIHRGERFLNFIF